MQKKLIALAVAGLASTAAFAQSNVQIYGIVDMAGAIVDGENGRNRYVLDSGVLSTSRIGFKGVEDLGNGLKALFTLEYGLTLDQNTGFAPGAATSGTSARQQFVGLTGGFGTAVAGRLQTTGLDFTVASSALGSSGPLGATNVVGGATLISAGSRADNAIAYISPSFAGLTVAINHARAPLAAEKAANTVGGENSATLASVSYENGPITAGAVYSTFDGGAGAGRDLNEWGIRGGYDFGVAKLQAAYQEQRTDQLVGSDDKNRKFVLSASAPVTAKIGVIGEYAKLYTKDGVNDNNRYAWTLAGTYSLSKRTTAYAGVVADRRETAAGLDDTTYAVGLRHSF